MKIKTLSLLLIAQLVSANICFSQHLGMVNKPFQIDFEIEKTSELAAINPFTDYRLQVTFEKDNQTFSVPGFYAADGHSDETSASEGGTWRVWFTPNEAGTWNYHVSFKSGKDISVDDDMATGQPVTPHDGTKGSIEVKDISNDAQGFAKSGRLSYNGSRYLHTEDGNPFLKFGANSPENFLAFEDIDGTYSYDTNRNYLKKWEPHIKDWKVGDPTWQGGKGKGIIGALNYLASKGMNDVYALTLNIEGDARDVWPFVGHERKFYRRYDVSKLAQWDIIFSHAEKLGIVMHFITQEKENELILDDGNTGLERKLYYRELIARFGYHKNIIWNMGEENGQAPFWRQGMNDQQRFAMIRYVKDHDPYKNPVVMETMASTHERDPIITPLLGFDRFDGLSMQIANIRNIHRDIKLWINKSNEAKRPWIVTMDEIGMWHTGTKTDEEDPTHDTLRQEVLWGALMAGAAGVEWYFGWLKAPHDLNAEDWRSRNNIWEQSNIAKEFFLQIPYAEMNSADSLISNQDDYCFTKPEETYVIYLKNGGTTMLDLSGIDGKYGVSWYDPRKGGQLQSGSVKTIKGGGKRSIGTPPSQKEKDWTVLIQKK